MQMQIEIKAQTAQQFVWAPPRAKNNSHASTFYVTSRPTTSKRNEEPDYVDAFMMQRVFDKQVTS